MANYSKNHHSKFVDRSNWNFEAMGVKTLSEQREVHGCMLWEYGRQSPFVRELERHWKEEFIQQLSIQQRQRLFPFTKSVVFPFPETTWQKLEPTKKQQFIDAALPTQVFIHPAVETLEREIEIVKTMPRNKKSQYRFIEITPDTWKFNSNEEIRTFFQDKVIGLRPADIPNPGGHGQRYRDMKVALRRLGLTRILALYSFADAKNIAKDHFPEQDLEERESWSKIRKNCEKKLRSIFPFLPPDEEQISFATRAELESIA